MSENVRNGAEVLFSLLGVQCSPLESVQLHLENGKFANVGVGGHDSGRNQSPEGPDDFQTLFAYPQKFASSRRIEVTPDLVPG